MDVTRISQGITMEMQKYINSQDVQKIEEASHEKQKAKYSKQELEKALKQLNKFFQDDNTHVEYAFHDKFRDTIVRVIDDNTKEVIMEVPPEKILDFVAKLCEMNGLVLDKKA